MDTRQDHAQLTLIHALDGGRVVLARVSRLLAQRSFRHGCRVVHNALVHGRGFRPDLLRLLLALLLIENALLRFELAAPFGIEPLAIFLLALLLGFLQLAYRILALGFGAGFFGDHAALDVCALGTHLNIDGLCRSSGTTAAGSGDLQFADRASPEGDLAWRRIIDLGGSLALAVRTAQEPQQLHLLGAADDLFLVGEFHARLAKLGQQLVNRHAQYLGELFDRHVRHSVLCSAVPALVIPCGMMPAAASIPGEEPFQALPGAPLRGAAVSAASRPAPT